MNIYRHSKQRARSNFNCTSRKVYGIFQCCMKLRCEMKTFRHMSLYPELIPWSRGLLKT